MILTEEITMHIAKLSGIELAGAEVASFTKDLLSVLGYMDKLSELDTDGVEPLVHVQDRVNYSRADAVAPSMPSEWVVANAPRSKDGYVAAPKTFGEASGA
ncbi:aspartyl/glutamyl-tRNA(Asn/Gln) amidotransferase subunit C [Clostridia bacterium]|nr:aspartyl/glutamyl-tRNA(Asn/Gln) amidotransferase subunit C [Clostridia bacterium]